MFLRVILYLLPRNLGEHVGEKGGHWALTSFALENWVKLQPEDNKPKQILTFS
jgi:hypothetical protein